MRSTLFLLVCVCVCMPVSVSFSSARKLLWFYQFSGETVSPSGFGENSPVNTIGKCCPVEI